MESESSLPTTRLELLENYAFKVTFDEPKNIELLMDEPPPLGKSLGPNASRFLSAAAGNCLSASLLFCLRKARLEVSRMTAEVQTRVERNEQGYWRVKELLVNITPELTNPEDKARMRRCLEIFENYCVVSSSLKNGINVKVSVNPA